MKKIIKIVSLLSLFTLIIISTAIPCFALVDNNSTGTGYISNIPSRIDMLSFSDKLTSIKLDNTVDLSTYDRKNVTVHYNSYNGFASNTSNIATQVEHKQYNGTVIRIKPTNSYAMVTVGKGMPPSGIFNSYQDYSEYMGGMGTQLDSGAMTVVSPGTDDIDDVQNTYGLQAKNYKFDFDNYYYDPNITSGSSQGTLTLATYVVVADTDYSLQQSRLESYFRRPIRATIEYYGEQGEVYATNISIEPYSVSTTRSPRLGPNDYCIVNVAYRYEYFINDVFRSLCNENGVELSRSYVTHIPSVTLHYTSSPANVGGVSGQGHTSPMIFSFSNFVYDSDVSPLSKLPSWGGASTPSDTSGLFEWIVDTVGGIFDIELFGFFSLGDLLGICVGIGIVFIILKIFAGG